MMHKPAHKNTTHPPGQIKAQEAVVMAAQDVSDTRVVQGYVEVDSETYRAGYAMGYKEGYQKGWYDGDGDDCKNDYDDTPPI